MIVAAALRKGSASGGAGRPCIYLALRGRSKDMDCTCCSHCLQKNQMQVTSSAAFNGSHDMAVPAVMQDYGGLSGAPYCS